MNILSRIILKAKHWQLFVITFVVPLLSMVVFMAIAFSKMADMPGSPALFIDAFRGNMKWLLVVTLICGIVTYLRLLSAGIETRKLAPAGARRKKGLFIFSILFQLLFSAIFTIVYLSVIDSIFMPLSTLVIDPGALQLDAKTFITIWAIFLPLNLFTILCKFYSIYYVAKTYKSAELEKDAKFEDYAAEFFLVLFWFIGVWVIQPKLNQMAGRIEAEKLG